MTNKERLRRNHTKNGKKKQKLESPDVIFNRKIRLIDGQIKEIKKRLFRDDFCNELFEKLYSKGFPIVIIKPQIRKALRLLEGTNYVQTNSS